MLFSTNKIQVKKITFQLFWVAVFIANFCVFKLEAQNNNSDNIELSQIINVLKITIVPLRSTRSEIEKIASPISGEKNKYETSVGMIIVRYAESPCIEYGWNVKENTVIDYTLYPKQTIQYASIKEKLDDLVNSAEHAGYEYYTNIKEGIQFNVYQRDFVQSIRFTPTAADSIFRCQGFPTYNPVAEKYYPYDKYYIGGKVDWVVGRIGGFLYELQKNKKFKGFLFVYGEKGKPKSKINRIIKRLETYSYNTMKIPRQRLTIAFGGYRDESQMEAFIIPNEYSDAIPTPKYAK